MKNIHEITNITNELNSDELLKLLKETKKKEKAQKKKEASQKQIVLQELLENGYITNLWCLQRGIWRLSHHVYQLRKENYKIETHYENIRGHKNCKYTMEATVEQKSFLDKLKQFVRKFIRFNI